MFLYHATPLHYLPSVLHSGALYAKSILAPRGIRPRASAVRRDRMLGLADWVHLSLHSATPLLRDKLTQGYPHALFVFDREAVLALPDAALLPYNTKAWKSRAACQPVTDAGEKADLLRRHAQTGRFPSLEVLVHYGLDFTCLRQIAFVNAEECVALADLLSSLALPPPAPLATAPELFPRVADYAPVTSAQITAYFEAAGRLARFCRRRFFPLIEMIHALWRHITTLGAQYGVDPLVFAVLYLAHHPLFWGTIAWLTVRARRRQRVAGVAALAVLFWFLPYLYVFAFGRGLPLWVYALSAAALLLGGTRAVKQIKRRLASGAKESG